MNSSLRRCPKGTDQRRRRCPAARVPQGHQRTALGLRHQDQRQGPVGARLCRCATHAPGGQRFLGRRQDPSASADQRRGRGRDRRRAHRPPVICDTDRKSLTEIAIETRALADRARAGRLRPEEFTGGTFTISNLGMFGVDHFTAVINPAAGSHPRRRARPPTKWSSSTAWWSSGRPSS